MKSLEDRIINELRTERELVPKATPAGLPALLPRWPRYLAAAAMISVVATLGAVWIFGLSNGGATPVATADGYVLTLHARYDLAIDEVEVLVTTSSPALREGGHDVYVGSVESETLTFAPPGTEKPIVQRLPELSLKGRDDIIGPVVYLGEVDGAQFTLYSTTANSLPGFLGRWLSTLSRQRLLCMGQQDGGASCGAGWETDSLTLGSSTGQTGGPFTHHLVWAGLPSDTAVVTWEMPDGDMFWQRPAGRVAAMTWETDGDNAMRVATMQAFNSDGELLLETTAG